MTRHVGIAQPAGSGRSRIVLIGMMGAGKTTLARQWSSMHPGPALWFDSDRSALIELGVSTVNEAFERFGIDVWRAAEREVITTRAGALVRGVELWSLGGGSVLDGEVQRALLDADVVAWLDAPVDTLWERVQGSDRPLAYDEREFRARYEARAALYESLSTVRVDVDRPLAEIALPREIADNVDIDAMCSGLIVGAHALRSICDLSVFAHRPVVLVSDQSVNRHADAVRACLADVAIEVVHDTRLPGGEWHKQLATVESLVQSWSAAGVHRRAVVIAIGGGSVLDTVGFAASIYARGMDWVSVPTTLLAQVDAGIGGKTAVNLGHLKNVIGTIHMPRLTVIDVSTLATLPDELLADGWVEAGKTGLLAGEALTHLATRVPATFASQRGDWLTLIDQCATFKDAVVAGDPADLDGIRAQLNLGHTAAHAIEAATAGGVSHGRAVAIGMNLALCISQRERGLDQSVIDEWVEACSQRGLSVTCDLPWQVIEPYLVHDKKQSEFGLGWVLLDAPGSPVTEVRVPMTVVASLWEEHVFVPATGAGATGLTAMASTAAPRVLVLFGVNLGQLGVRDPVHYGSLTLAGLISQVEAWAGELGLRAECRQTDSLERFVAALHEARTAFDAVIVNPGAWTHHERALHDAVEPLTIPVIEYHLSDVGSREEWRHHSVLAGVVDHVVSGEGAEGARTALQLISDRLGRG